MSADYFMSLNGWKLPIREGSASMNVKRFGDKGYNHNGRPLKSKRGVVRSWTMRSTIRTRCEGASIELLVHGLFDTYHFNDTINSSRGVTPEFPLADYTLDATGGPLSSGSIEVLSGGAIDVITYDTRICTKMSVAYYFRASGGSDWTHVIQQSDGDGYLNGTFVEALSGPVTIVGQRFALVEDFEYSHVIVFPDNIDASLAYAIYAAEQSWLPAPYLTLDGKIVGCIPREVIGEKTNTNYLQAYRNGWDCALRDVGMTFQARCLNDSKRVEEVLDVWDAPDEEFHENFEVVDGWP